LHDMKYWAKSLTEETIEDHTENLLSGLEQLTKEYGEAFSDNELGMIKLAAESHDYGKRIYQFQKTIYNHKKMQMDLPASEIKRLDALYKNEGRMIPHGYLSPCVLDSKQMKTEYGLSDDEILLVRSAVFWHHERDIEPEPEKLKKIISEDLQPHSNRKLRKLYLNQILRINELPSQRTTDWQEIWLRYAVGKGILNRLDYWASSDRNTEFEISPETSEGNIGVIVADTMSSEGWSITPAQKFMQEHSGESIIVTASTGSGKTEGALMWAGGEKLFYTLPLRVSINAIYNRIVDSYRYPEDHTALIHSDSLAYLINRAEDSQAAEELFIKNKTSRLFCCPVSVCTIDQLFTFIYKYRGCEQLLATLKYSCVVIDEIQAYSPELIGKLIVGLSLIRKAGGKFLIMTATLPPVVKHFIIQEVFKGNTEACPEFTFFSPIVRHFIRVEREQDFDYELIKQKAENSKVLVICNTVKKAQEVCAALENMDTDCHLLHSRFIQKHKRMLEDEILKFSADPSKTGIWVTTQIVEASLDIDFGYLFTEMSSADSLLQRLGRCWRKRAYELSEPNVFVYDTQNGVADSYSKDKVYDKEIYERSLKYIGMISDHLVTEEEKEDYIKKVYSYEELRDSSKCDKGRFYSEIEEAIKKFKGLHPGIYSKNEAVKLLRDIQSYAYIPISIYNQVLEFGEFDDLVKQAVLSGTGGIQAEQRIKDLSVSVPYPENGARLIPGLPKHIRDIEISNCKYDIEVARDAEGHEYVVRGLGLLKEKEEQDDFLE